MCGGGSVPPVARYPSRSDTAVEVLGPHRQTLRAGLGKNPIILCDRAISMNDTVATCCLSTRLESTTAQGAGLGQVKQQGGPKGPNHTGLGDKPSCTSLSVAQESSEASGGDDGEHRSGARGG